MIAAERRSLILEMIRLDGVVSIAAAAERLGTSTVTVRRDLDQLAAGGLVSRTHGGAVASGATRESPYTEKLQQAAEEKARIAARAAELVHDGETLVIGPGTTTEALARHLVHRAALTVVTNSLVVADVLAGSAEHDVVVTGGALRGSIRALVGDATVSTFRSVHADKTFLSGNGLAADFGLSTPTVSVADADRAMARAGNQVIVLADHTKIGVRTPMRTVATTDIAQLVTDRGSPRQELDAFEEAGVQVHVV